MNQLSFFASGKLLLFGEYLVLRGAKSIVMPLRFGQSLNITPHASANILWEAYEKEKCWLRIELSPELEILQSSDKEKALVVQQLLRRIRQEKPSFKIKGLHFRFDIDFDRNYGLGTSSTLISLLSQWSGADPYLLQAQRFSGSGFDIAAATAPGTFVYQVQDTNDNRRRIITPFSLHEKISSRLLFIYTGEKQNSLREVNTFGALETSSEQTGIMSAIVEEVLRCTDIEAFERLILQSESLLGKILQKATVKKKRFADYPFAVKSSGAWGGDFVMATYRDETQARAYFHKKGMHPVFNYRQLIKS